MPVYDEHVWLSLLNAVTAIRAIEQALIGLAPELESDFTNNAANLISEIQALHFEFHEVVRAAPHNTLLFADRFPFRYFVEDYGIRYYAAFTGCSAETEASFATITFLINKVNELGLNTIMTTESPVRELAETIRNNSEAQNQQILALDSMQSITAADVAAGVTYLGIMRENLNVLRQALQ